MDRFSSFVCCIENTPRLLEMYCEGLHLVGGVGWELYFFFIQLIFWKMIEGCDGKLSVSIGSHNKNVPISYNSALNFLVVPIQLGNETR